MLRKREFFTAFIASTTLTILIILPQTLWKSKVTGANLIESLVSPLPGNLPGTSMAADSWSNASDFVSSFPFPVSIIIPDSIGAISLVLGIGWIVSISYFFGNKNRNIAAELAILRNEGRPDSRGHRARSVRTGQSVPNDPVRP